MFKFLFLLHRKGKWNFFISVLLLGCLFGSIPFAYNSLHSSKVALSESIHKYSRGSYDILVRHPEARSDIEQKKGIVEENYLTGGIGGISLAQYKKITDIPDVEVAAPVSVLGFFTNDSGGIKVELPSVKENTWVTSIKISNETGLPDSYKQVLDTHVVNIPLSDPPIMPNRSMGFMEEDGKKFINFTLPTNYNLLVAVDPEQEDKLTAQKMNITDRLGTEKSTKLPPSIPLLINEDSDVSMQALFEVRKSTKSEEEWKQQFRQMKDLSEVNKFLEHDLKNPPILKEKFDLSKELQPFRISRLDLDQKGNLQKTFGGINSSLDTSVYYLTDRLNYEEAGKGENYDFLLKPKDGKYRPLIKKEMAVRGGLPEERSFDYQITGTYSGKSIGNSDLDQSPLGIYSFSPVYLVLDQDGNKQNIELKKDLTPDTFLPIQASAITNLSNIELLKGETPIDAIRVRVKDIGGYDSQTEAKIKKVAKSIYELTGLHTDIVAGASKKQMHVKIPETSDFPNVGIVKEIWTTLGVAASITKSMDYVSLFIMLSLFLLTAVFAVVHTRSLLTVRRKEYSVLLGIGWTMRDLKKMLALEWGIKLVGGLSLSVLVLIFLHQSVSIAWESVLYIQFIIVIWIFASIWYQLFKINKQDVQVGVEKEWKKKHVALSSVFGLAWGNFKSQLAYTGYIVLSLAASLGTILFLLNMLFGTRKNVQTTFLGEAVNLNMFGFHLFILVALVVLILFNLFEHAAGLIGKRKNEIVILNRVGWTNRSIRKLLFIEFSLTYFLGFSISLFLGLGVFRIFYTDFPIPIYAQILCMAIFMSIFLLIGFYYLLLKINKLNRHI